MNPGAVGVAALLLVGGALYWASTSLGDFFADRNEAITAVIEDTTDSAGQALGLLGDAAEEAGEAVEEAAEDLADAASEAVEEAGEAVEDMADAASDAVEEAEETVAALTDSAQETVADAVEDMSDIADAALATDDDVAETLEELAHDLPDTVSQPGTTPVLDVVRVEPTGEVIIAGNAPSGDRVGLLYNEEIIAQADVAPGGDFVLLPDQALVPGEGSMEVVTLDGDGEPVTRADTQIAVVLPDEDEEGGDGFLVGVLRPGQPVEILEREAPDSDAVEGDLTALELTDATEQVIAAVSEADEPAAEPVAEPVAETSTEVASVDASTNTDEPAEAVVPFVVVDAIELEGQRIWIAGASAPGTIVRLYQDNELLGEAMTGEEGRFLYEGELRDALGEVTVRADALATGTADVVARAAVPFEMPVLASALDTTADAAMDDDMTEDMADSMSDAVEDVSEDTTETVVETAEATEATMVEEATEMASEAAAETVEAVTDAVEVAESAVEETVEAVADAVEVAESAVEETVAETVEVITDAVEVAENAVEETVADTVDAVTDAVEVAESAVEETATEIAAVDATAEAAPTTTPVIASPNERVSVLDTGQVIIRRGDNLWRISRRVFGQGIRYTSIYDANRDQIGDPALIFPGQVFALPQAQAEWGAVPGVEALEPDQIPGAVATETQN